VGNRAEKGLVRPTWRSALVPVPLLILVLGAFAAPAPAGLAATGAVAIVPLADEVGFHHELVRWASLRLGEMLAGAGFQVVPLDETARLMRQMGLRDADLIGLSRPAELGVRLGAGVVITGRLTRLDLDPPGSGLFPPVTTPKEVEGPAEAFMILEMRVLEVPTRHVLLRTEVSGQAAGPLRLRLAAERALADFLRQLRNAP